MVDGLRPRVRRSLVAATIAVLVGSSLWAAVPATAAAALITLTQTTPAVQAAGSGFSYAASVSCSAVAGGACEDVVVDFPVTLTSPPAAGASAPTSWPAVVEVSEAGIATLTSVPGGWRATLTRSLAPGESVSVGFRTTPPRVDTADGTTWTVGATVSGTDIATVSADPVSSQATNLAVAVVNISGPTYTSGGDVTLNVSRNFGADGALRPAPGTPGTTTLTLPAEFDYVSSTDGGAWDPVTRTITWTMNPATTATGFHTVVVHPNVATSAPRTFTATTSYTAIGGQPASDDDTHAVAIFDHDVWGDIFRKVNPSSMPSVSGGIWTDHFRPAYRIGDAPGVESVYTLQLGVRATDYDFELVDPMPCLSVVTSTGYESGAPGAGCAAPAMIPTAIVARDVSWMAGVQATLLRADGSTSTHAMTGVTRWNIPAGSPVVQITFTGTVKAGSQTTSYRSLLVHGQVVDDVAIGETVENVANVRVWTPTSTGYGTDSATHIVVAPFYGMTATAGNHSFLVGATDFVWPQWSAHGELGARRGEQRSAVILPPEVQVDVLHANTNYEVTLDWNGPGTGTLLRSRGAGAQSIRVVGNTLGSFPYTVLTGWPDHMTDTCSTDEMARDGSFPRVNSSQQYLVDDDGTFLLGSTPGVDTTLCATTGTITVRGSGSSFTVRKTVQSADGASWLSSPGQPVLEGDARAVFRIAAANTGSNALVGAVVYDLLPEPGDTGTVGPLVGEGRGSTGTPELVAVTAPAGWTIAYSTADNPCRPEVLPVNPGCVDSWSTVAPGHLGAVTAIRFARTSTLAAGASATFFVTMDAGSIDPGQQAWNTVAANAADGALLAPAESPKVGFVRASTPGIQIVKEVRDDAGAWVERAELAPGSTAHWRLTVTNTGDVPLVDVAVDDTAAPGCSIRIGDLAVGESRTVQCSTVDVVSDLVNVARVTAVSSAPDATAVDDEDDARVVVSLSALAVTGSASATSTALLGSGLLALGALVVLVRPRRRARH